MANVSGANPETWIGMQIASTSRAATSVNTVAPMVTVTASFRSLPSFSTIGYAIRVWEARSDPMSSAPTQGYPAQSPTRSPAVRGSANVSSPKADGSVAGPVELHQVDFHPGEEHQQELAKFGEELNDLAVLGGELKTERADQHPGSHQPDHGRQPDATAEGWDGEQDQHRDGEPGEWW